MNIFPTIEPPKSTSSFDLGPSWENILSSELSLPYLAALASFVSNEREGATPVYPPQHQVFNTFKHTPFDKVKVVIVGQDPYHGVGQAHGLSFSVPHGISTPPSLKNIFKELQADLGIHPPTHGCLTSWADQGVLLLNSILTVRQGQPMSHQGQGWERFTDAVIRTLSHRPEPLVFVLWGKSAQEKCRHLALDAVSRHLTLTAPHPSPFSAHQGFLGCRHFSKINQFLVENHLSPVDWNL